MGKRKRRASNKASPPPPADSIPQASQEDQQSEQSSFDRPENSADVMDASVKRLPGHQSPLDQNRIISFRHSRHPFDRHYSRRSSSHHSNASPSKRKGSPANDAKLDNKDLLNFSYQESRDRIFKKPERIRSTENALSGNMRKMECTICHKRLRKNPFISNNSISSTDLSVVAVLACGHAYHADCLEQETSDEDIHDPPCPLCVSQNI